MSDGLVSLTPAAIDRARQLLASQAGNAIGIRLAVKPTGCSGWSYVLDFAKEQLPGDALVEQGEVRLLLDERAAKLAAGTEVDYVEDRLGAQFVFRNPRETARCGCGESFSV